MKRRTVITITHRLRTISHADTIFVIQEGEVVEQGTNEELLEHDGLYSELLRLAEQHDVRV